MPLEYNWQAALLTFLILGACIALAQRLAFMVPAIARTRQVNRDENQRKWRELARKYHHRVKPAQKIGLSVNLGFYIVILPFFVTLSAQPLWRIALDVVLILMVYDLFYYGVHRFLFHGKGYFRRVHAVHHQARSRVTSIDSYLLHPWEIVIGTGLYFATIVLLGVLGLSPFHVATIVISNFIYTQLNQVNHCRIDLDGFPFRTVNWIAMKHDAHHLDMHRGNYATITLLYDKLFGTIEMHPLELQDAEARGQAST
ncbi:sterol desaturase family protein [Parahaliea aestuarii]|uniref:Sterol desaturase family protein n=1 Tax=Parahaliea aestuarii TaxID=1852021 RepID=A0A5C8ZTB5_9GAMM|nr:sterol desaturase family protein [Parahaliea aestuarii]TXS91748.1 sterol desaturase family protein [Parahaliea aestuarii]